MHVTFVGRKILCYCFFALKGRKDLAGGEPVFGRHPRLAARMFQAPYGAQVTRLGPRPMILAPRYVAGCQGPISDKTVFLNADHVQPAIRSSAMRRAEIILSFRQGPIILFVGFCPGAKRSGPS